MAKKNISKILEQVEHIFLKHCSSYEEVSSREVCIEPKRYNKLYLTAQGRKHNYNAMFDISKDYPCRILRRYKLCVTCDYILSTLGILVCENRYPTFNEIITRSPQLKRGHHKDINHETIPINH